jgi:hypothetical protein
VRSLIAAVSVLTLAASAVAAEPVARADDDMGARVAAADSYLATRPGEVGSTTRRTTTTFPPTG